MFEALLAPRGVAVIGASRHPNKLGYGIARNLVVSGYQGELYFVNPHGGVLFDRPIWTDIASIPDPVDLGVIIIPAKYVPQALEDCGQRGIHTVIIGSGGFKEIGPEGAALEQECLRIAVKHGIRVVGPNCIGYLDTHMPIDTTFLPLPGPTPGDIAFLSHSGAICEAVIDWARGQGFGLSRLVSLGNQMDLTESDLLPAFAEDPNTRVVAMYLEGVRDGPSFIERARQVTPQKPVVAIKVGRSPHGRDAVASHTGVLAGEDTAYEAAFRKAGVIRAQSSEEMFDWARALAWCPLPEGRRMAVLTNAGGPGAIAVDAMENNSLEMAQFSQDTLEKLSQLLPPAASIRNPVDILASGGPMEYAQCLDVLLDDDDVDGVMIILAPPPMTTAAEVAGAIVPCIQSATKPVVVALMGEELIMHGARLFRQSRVPDYRFPERAASALRVLAERAEQLAQDEAAPCLLEDIQKEEVQRVLEHASTGVDGFVDGQIAAQIVEAYGIRIVSETHVRTPEEAVEAAERLGFPVALKVVSPDLPHKSDVGGVVLNLKGVRAVKEGFQQVTERPKKIHPEAEIHGALVQPMIASGQEVIVGMVRDAQFGPLMMFGLGGVEVEGLGDVAFALTPLECRDTERLLEDTWAGQRLKGYRAIPPADREAAMQAVLRLGQLAEDFPQILEVEINPLLVLPEEKGAIALDVRLRLNGSVKANS
ncbi:MAG: acetate--CoA ligase family protein [Anaerolineales bacterium]